MRLFRTIFKRAALPAASDAPKARPKGVVRAMPGATPSSPLYRQGEDDQEEEEQVQPLRRAQDEQEQEENAQALHRQVKQEEEELQTIRREEVGEQDEEQGAQALHRQMQEEEEEESLQALRRQEEEEEEPAQALRRQEEEEEEPAQALRRQEEEEEEPAQALHRQAQEEEEEPAQALRRQPQDEEEESIQTLRRATIDAGVANPPSDALPRPADGPQQELPDMRALHRDVSSALFAPASEVGMPSADMDSAAGMSNANMDSAAGMSNANMDSAAGMSSANMHSAAESFAGFEPSSYLPAVEAMPPSRKHNTRMLSSHGSPSIKSMSSSMSRRKQWVALVQGLLRPILRVACARVT